MPFLLMCFALALVLMVKPCSSKAPTYVHVHGKMYKNVDNFGVNVMTLDTKRVDSFLLCVVLCARCLGCVALHWHRDESTCRTYRVFYAHNQPEVVLPRHPSVRRYAKVGYPDRSTVGSSCLSDNDCPPSRNFVCFTKTCKCVPGYSYNPATDSCVRRCKTYGYRFTIYKDLGIASYNDKGGNEPSIEECSEWCLREKTVSCMTIDYNYEHGACALSSTGYLDAPSSNRETAAIGWALGSRDCA